MEGEGGEGGGVSLAAASGIFLTGYLALKPVQARISQRTIDDLNLLFHIPFVEGVRDLVCGGDNLQGKQATEEPITLGKLRNALSQFQYLRY